MHHPLAIAAAPLMLGLRWRERGTWLGAVVAGLMLIPRAVRLLTEALPGGAGQGPPELAMGAYLTQGGAIAVLVLLGPLLGLISPRTRPLATRVLASLALLLAMGIAGGYLRDHHLRLLTIPAIVGWAAVPWPGIGVMLVALIVPRGPLGPPSVAQQPGTLGLATSLTDQVAQDVAPPLVVDGAWLSGGPVASPAAIMLDLYLRGWAREDLTPGHTVVVVVSADREDLGGVSPGGLEMIAGDRYALLVGEAAEVAKWSQAHCGGTLGGAWDALSVLHPERTLDESREWWACP